MRYKFQREQIH